MGPYEAARSHLLSTEFDLKIARVRVLLRGALESAPALTGPRDFLRVVERYGRTAVTLAKSLANQNERKAASVEALAHQFVNTMLDEIDADYKAGQVESQSEMPWWEDGVLKFSAED